jgi:hypothetical protein
MLINFSIAMTCTYRQAIGTACAYRATVRCRHCWSLRIAQAAAETKTELEINMKWNPWTLALVSAGVVSLPGASCAEEKPSSVLTALSSTTLSGYVDT